MMILTSGCYHVGELYNDDTSDTDTDTDTDSESNVDSDTGTDSDADSDSDTDLDNDIDMMAAGYYHSLLLISDGSVLGVGGNNYGQIGDGTSGTDRLTPMQVIGPDGVGHLTDVVAIAAGINHSIALKNDGTVWAWGESSSGQLGDNQNTTDKLTPVQVLGVGGSGHLTDVVAIAAGSVHSIALKDDGTVYAWGYNFDGEMGNNTDTVDQLTPVQVLGVGGSGHLTDVVAIAAGSVHSIALKENGTVYAWGNGDQGQIGDTTSGPNRLTPVQVIGSDGISYLADVVDISADSTNSIALKDDGTVYVWGDNSYSQIGNGTTVDGFFPTQVIGPDGVGYLTDIVSIVAGGYHSMALKTNGTAYAWGRNDSGQTGNGTTTSPIPTPTAVIMP